MNINEFERSKPKKTLKKINQLIIFVSSCLPKQDQSQVLPVIKAQLEEIKKSFLEGE